MKSQLETPLLPVGHFVYHVMLIHYQDVVNSSVKIKIRYGEVHKIMAVCLMVCGKEAQRISTFADKEINIKIKDRRARQ